MRGSRGKSRRGRMLRRQSPDRQRSDKVVATPEAGATGLGATPNDRTMPIGPTRRRLIQLTLGALGIVAFTWGCSAAVSDFRQPKFKVIAFFTGKKDQAHISFVEEANRRFPAM